MRATKKLVLLIVLPLFIFSLFGCENDEDNALAMAQKCLDDIPSTATQSEVQAAALNCEPLLASYESPQAYLLKCSMKFLIGGITTKRMTTAFKQLDDTVPNKEAHFMSALAFTSVPLATAAFDTCKKSEVAGLIYLAALSRIGAVLNNAAGVTINDENFDPTDADVLAGLTECADNNTCDDVAVGQSAIILGESYCASGTNADSSVCTDINNAITQGGGDPAAVAQQLYDLLQ